MPLFKSHHEPEPVVEPPARKGSIFTRNRAASPEPLQTTTNHNRGFFSRRRSSDDSSLGHPTSNHSVRSGTSGSFFRGGNNFNNFNVHKDPTIIAAKEKVTFAEKAEIEADRALAAARAMVREARDHVRFLEREAAEE
jgi:hypothetical protein